MTPKPKSRIPNSISEEEYEELKEEFCEATQYCESSEEEEILVVGRYEENEDGIPIVPSSEEILYSEVREIIENGYYKCPICGESFDNIPDFREHWEDRHKEKYGAYRRFRQYKYLHPDTELTEDESKEMLRLWLESRKMEN